MKPFAYLAALAVVCTGTVVCAGPALKKPAPPVAAPLKTTAPLYTLTIADSDGFSQSVRVGETDTFSVETTLGGKTYTISGDTLPEKGATALKLKFDRKMVTIVAERFPSERHSLVETTLLLAPTGRQVAVGSNSSSDSNGVETKYQVTASLTFAPVTPVAQK